jgi:DNA-binding response OmpR family regulator
MDNLKTSILVVEDDKTLSLLNCMALKSEGYDVAAAYTLHEARTLLQEITPDIILLDIKLPDGDGVDLCREIRGETDAHIIFLTSDSTAESEMVGLTVGGNDYLRKPYDVALLRQRVKNAVSQKLMQKTPREARSDEFIHKGNLTLDVALGKAFIDGQQLQFSQQDYRLLLLLVKNEGQTMSAESLYKTIWKRPMNEDSGAAKQAISRLRAKIEGSGYTITFKRGEGYMFEAE